MRRMLPGERLFAPVNDLLIILSGIAHASSLMAGGSVHTEPKPVFRVGTRWPDYGLGLPLRGPLEHALEGKIPRWIEIGIITSTEVLTEPLKEVKLQTGGLREVMAHVVSPIFLLFFERYNDWLKTNAGPPVTWPTMLNFARVIRNAVAHGKIKIDNPSAPAVTWRGLSYSYADNGRQIIGTDVSLGEILALMFDANDALDAAGVPIL
jgi:hypothetical protein